MKRHSKLVHATQNSEYPQPKFLSPYFSSPQPLGTTLTTTHSCQTNTGTARKGMVQTKRAKNLEDLNLATESC